MLHDCLFKFGCIEVSRPANILIYANVRDMKFFILRKTEKKITICGFAVSVTCILCISPGYKYHKYRSSP